MTHRFPMRCILATLLATSALPLPVVAEVPQTAVTPLLAAPGLDRAGVDRLYTAAVADNSLPEMHSRLEAIATSAAPAERRAIALLVKARLAWRAGSVKYAMRYTDRALALAPKSDALLLKAELVDARGRWVEALDWYRRARPTLSGKMAATIDLRIAIMAGMRDTAALTGFARTQPTATADRIAVVLGLLGQPKAALELSVAAGGDETPAAHGLREAQWSIEAGEPARDTAIRAFRTATVADDRAYALALVVETYREANDLPGALAFVEAIAPQGAEVVRARVDLLSELGRTDAAARLVERSTDPMLRRRLAGLIAATGRNGAGADELRRLIAASPNQAQWVGGLAAIHLASGDEAQAVDAYRRFFAVNRGRTDVLIAGAQQMIAQGLQDSAITLLRSEEANPALAQAARLFLFETYADQGDDDKALAELEAVRGSSNDPATLAEVAAGYQRLGRASDAFALLTALETRGVAVDYDQRLFMAQLAEAAGKRDEALRRWRQLWDEARLPARRSFVERRLVRLLTETGKLASATADLDRRQAGGTLRVGEIDLLLAMKAAQQDYEGVMAAIARFDSGTRDVARLRAVAILYARYRNYPELDRILRRLMEIDPTQRDMHARQLIMVRIRQGKTSTPRDVADIDALIEQIKPVGSPEQFRASVYAMGGMNDRAEEQLMIASATRPADDDALLQLAGTLNKQGRQADAVGLLQLTMLDARSASAFATAAGGLLDVLATGPAERDRTDRVSQGALLLWVERLILERIVTVGPNRRLLDLLADIAGVAADRDLKLRALVAALPTAGESRPSILRELLTVSGSDDSERVARYGLRLLALGKSYPPDLYSDIGRALLRQERVAAAERAFAMTGDAAGLVNVDELRGNAYASQLRLQSALANYNRALLTDRNDLSLIVEASIVREQTGQGSAAQPWYWRGLRGLVVRQPLQAMANKSDETALDTQAFYPTLVEGLLMTWPDDTAAHAAVLAELQRLFADTLARVEREGVRRAYAAYPRLSLIVDVGHRIADAYGDGGMARGWDSALDRMFAADPAYRRSAAQRRNLVGPAQPGAYPSLTAGTLAQAENAGNLRLAAVMAAQAGDTSSAARIAADALMLETAATIREGGDAEPQRSGSPEPVVTGATYLPVLVELMKRLPAPQFAAAVLPKLNTSPLRLPLLFELFRASPADYARLQKLSGSPLLSRDDLVRLALERGNGALAFAPSAAGPNNTRSWIDAVPDDQLVTLYDGIVTAMEQTGQDNPLGSSIIRRLVTRPLDAAQRAAAAGAFRRDVLFARNRDNPSIGPVLLQLLQLDAAPANRPFVLEAARAAEARYPDQVPVADTLEAWFAQDKPRALQLLANLIGASVTDDQDPIGAIVARRYPELREEEADRFLSASSPGPADADEFYNRFVVGRAQTPPDRLAVYYRKLIAADPGRLDYFVGLLMMQARRGQWPAFVDALRSFVSQHPDNRDAATMLALAYRLIDRPAEASAIVAASTVNPDDASWIAQLWTRSAAADATEQMAIERLFRPVYSAYAARFPGLASVAAARSKGVVAPEDAGAADASDQLRPLFAPPRGADATPPAILRGLWRESASAQEGGQPDNARRAKLVRALVTSWREGGDHAALLRRPEMVGELERYLSATPVGEQAGRSRLYAMVADGLTAQGANSARRSSAMDIVRDGADAPGRQHAFLLAVALADAAGGAVDAESRAALLGYVRSMPAMSADTRLVLARLLSRSKDWVDATALLRGLLAQVMYPVSDLDRLDNPMPVGPQIVAVLNGWEDRVAAQATYDTLSRDIADGGQADFALPPLNTVRDGQL